MAIDYHELGKLFSSWGDHQQAIHVKPSADAYNDRGLPYAGTSQFQIVEENIKRDKIKQ